MNIEVNIRSSDNWKCAPPSFGREPDKNSQRIRGIYYETNLTVVNDAVEIEVQVV